MKQSAVRTILSSAAVMGVAALSIAAAPIDASAAARPARENRRPSFLNRDAEAKCDATRIVA